MWGDGQNDPADEEFFDEEDLKRNCVSSSIQAEKTVIPISKVKKNQFLTGYESKGILV